MPDAVEHLQELLVELLDSQKGLVGGSGGPAGRQHTSRSEQTEAVSGTSLSLSYSSTTK